MKIVKWAILFVALYGVERFCHSQTDGFAMARIRSSLTYQEKWETTPPNQAQLAEICKQKFHYLTKGAQCYIFASEDQKYVLKFFRFDHMRVPLLLESLSVLEEKKQKKRQALEKDFASYKIAFEDLKEETGLFAVHLNKSKGQYPAVTLVDKLQIAHIVPLDEMEFILQRRAELVFPYLDRLMAEGDTDQAKDSISSLVQLMATIQNKGIIDFDPKLKKNFGFIEGKAVQIDLGRFIKKQTGGDIYPALRMKNELSDWLNANHPSLLEHLDQACLQKDFR